MPTCINNQQEQKDCACNNTEYHSEYSKKQTIAKNFSYNWKNN
ncbi:hypothetical protein [Spiroplasma attinicola]|nr:hypothetical protein [Spiroplasma sp. JKS002671]